MYHADMFAYRIIVVLIAVLSQACAHGGKGGTPVKNLPGYAPFVPDNSGEYMSPYTHDGVLADWVDKGVSAKAAGQLGKTALGVTGGQVGQQYGVLAGVLGRTIGQKLGEATARSIAVNSAGGWDYIRDSSDVSFNSLAQMARFLKRHYPDHPHYALAIELTGEIYPKFRRQYKHSLKGPGYK